MNHFAIIRLGKDTVPEIKTLDSHRKSPAEPIAFTIRCSQVPSEAEAGDFAFFCLGSDNNKGIPTPWSRGLRALGKITEKKGGPNYNDEWQVSVEVRVILPESVSQKALLAKAPTAYYWCSDIPVLGVDTHSNQTVQIIRDREPNQDVKALLHALTCVFPQFEPETIGAYPELKSYFDYRPANPRLALTEGKAEERKKEARIGDNIIFFGPPGTGKSHAADAMAGNSLDTIRVLFHPEYTYSDFIGLYKPVVGSDPASTVEGFDGGKRAKPICYFDFVPGPLLLALARAFQNPSEHVFLIIDEINRGDCAAIFGDIFQLLDRSVDGASRYGISMRQEIAAWFKKQKVHWDRGGEEKLRFPGNFTIIATMNTSDQSLLPMDSAFKRRWQWKSCNLDFGPVLKFLENRIPVLDDGKKKWNWIKLVERINSAITKFHLEDKQIGPWFMSPDEESANIDRDAFGNKCLYYLWHDVFKDDQDSENSPFKATKPEIRTFQELQQRFGIEGLGGIFKSELLEGAQIDSSKEPAVAAEPQT